MLRHLPPTATPLPVDTLLSAVLASESDLEQFQTAFARYTGTDACRSASSGRTALYLLLRALAAESEPQRTTVILPAYTCPSLGKVVLEAGLQTQWVDIDPATLAFVPHGLASAINSTTLAVICVHPFGIPHALDAVLELAHAAGAVVVEDAAQSLGARAGGRLVGTRADFGLFSLGPGKPLSAGGGGMVTANNSAAAELTEKWPRLPTRAAASTLAVLRLAAFSMAFHPLGWWFATRAGAQKAGENEANWGFALTGLTPAQAKVVLAQLPHLSLYNQHRRRNAVAILNRLAGLDWLVVPAGAASQATEPIYLRLPIVVDSEARCAELYCCLRSAGIGAGRMYQKTMPEFFPQTAAGRNPGAERVARCLLTLPTHHYVTPHDIDRIGAIFERINGQKKSPAPLQERVLEPSQSG